MSAKRRTTALVSGVLRYSAICWASAGLELPATSLIAPFLPAIQKSSPSLAPRRRGHNKAGYGGQYGCKCLSEAFTNTMNPPLVASGGHRNGVPRRGRLGRAAAWKRHRAVLFIGSAISRIR